MKTTTNQERLNELFDEDPRNDTAIAAEFGVSKQSVSAWRSGLRSPKKKMLIAIADYYKVSIEWLMGFDVEKSGTVKSHAVVPDSDTFRILMDYVTPEDQAVLMEIFERAYKKAKEKGAL